MTHARHEARSTLRCVSAACVLLALGGPAGTVLARGVTHVADDPSLPQQPTPPAALAPQHDEYPPVRNLSLVHFFSIEGDVKTEPLRKGIADLGTAEVEARIVYGPENTSSRPGRWFLAIEAPAALKSTDVAKTLKRAASSVDVLVCTSFDAQVGAGTAGMGTAFGMTARDWVLGMSNDLRWADTFIGRYQFYSVPGRLDAAAIKDRMKKLIEPFAQGEAQGRGDVGTLVRDGFTWKITSELDAAQAKKLDKSLEKLDGVVLARADAAGKTLLVQFDLESLRVSAPALVKAKDGVTTSTSSSSSPGGPAGDPVRARFDVNPLLDLLAKEKVTVGPLEKKDAARAGAEGGDKPPEKAPPGG